MGKAKSIDRDQMLDVVERIIIQNGASALTIEAIAKAMGISKGGVQSCFGNKKGIINALIERWNRRYDEACRKKTGKDPGEASPVERIKEHVTITSEEESLLQSAACHLIILLESTELRDWLKRWHDERIGALTGGTEEDRRARIAYLATEGAFFLKYFGIATFSEQEWKDVFSDIGSFVEGRL